MGYDIEDSELPVKKKISAEKSLATRPSQQRSQMSEPSAWKELESESPSLKELEKEFENLEWEEDDATYRKQVLKIILNVGWETGLYLT